MMLVLSRHVEESILIGDSILITVTAIRGDRVRIGITAPVDIPVHRLEVAERIERERREALRERFDSFEEGDRR